MTMATPGTNTLDDLTVRCFSQRSKHWRHTHNGKKTPSRHTRRNSEDSASGSSSSESSSSKGSQSTSPTTPDFEPSIADSSQTSTRRTSIKILTWNVDFMASNVRTRMSAVLNHIQNDVFECPNDEQPEPCCILLQEVEPDSFPEILEHEWIREHFCVVPTRAGAWPSVHYGNVTLVSRTIPVLSARLLRFGDSWMNRHAVVVDLRLDAPDAPDAPEDESGGEDGGEAAKSGDSFVTVRIANVHLESLPAGTPLRPGQLAATADLLREEGIHAGIAAGDMNAITPDDTSVHEEAGLVDAWAGDNEDADALTWGFQPPNQFPPGRLDKILYTPGDTCAVDEPQRVGVGLKTLKGQWASDHYGLLATLRVL